MVTLAIHGLEAAYGRKRILHGIDLPDIRSGQVTAVLGANAVGKSTLFRRIAGLIPGAGRVLVDGVPIAERPPRHPLRAFYMPQDHSVSAVLNVFDAVLLSIKQGSGWRVTDADADAVTETLITLEIGDLAQRSLGELSGGQRQLVAIAQALVCGSRMLLMDEPTSALDLQRQVEILELLRRVAVSRDAIVLVALHDLNQALTFSDRVIVLRDGALAAFGRPAEVLTPDMLREAYGVEARLETCSKSRPLIIVDRSVRSMAGPDLG
ncbi:MAG: transporter ATP-binding protein [Rubritepida sp.]|nr:transporter ATP-binding protein [Rubritepida sp.]